MGPRLLTAIVLVAALATSGCFEDREPAPKPSPATPAKGFLPLLSGESTKTLASVVSFDGHRIPVTVYRPTEAGPVRPVPVLLHSHGWAGQRIANDNAFRDYHQAGFAVISIDMRGHGEARATSMARIHHIDYEIKDVREVITHLAKQDWVAKQAPDDPIIGAFGGSYGGGYQLLTAATDPRLDAIAPDITWNDLLQSLAPNGGVRSAWVDILYFSGNANARLDPSIHQGFTIVHTQNRVPDGSRPGEPDFESQLLRSSPASYPDDIRIPTFLTQGINDTLFHYNQAAANLEQIQAAGGDVRLTTHLGGHILNTRGTIAAPAPRPVGLQGPTSGSPCGSLRNMTVSWFQSTLLDTNIDLGPRFCLALEDHTSLTFDEYPPSYIEQNEFALGPSTVVSHTSTEVARLRVLEATSEPVTLAGIPVLTGNVTANGDTILYYSLNATRGATSRTLNAQVMPQPISGARVSFELELGGIGARLQPGETLYLVVSTSNEQFAHNGARSLAAATLTDLRLTLPIVATP